MHDDHRGWHENCRSAMATTARDNTAGGGDEGDNAGQKQDKFHFVYFAF
jgi:hypothetical protein